MKLVETEPSQCLTFECLGYHVLCSIIGFLFAQPQMCYNVIVINLPGESEYCYNSRQQLYNTCTMFGVGDFSNVLFAFKRFTSFNVTCPVLVRVYECMLYDSNE